MQNKKYTYLIYFIAAVIAATLAIQVYWNFKNYQAGKQQLINEVQSSLDLAIDNYFIDLAEKNTVGLAYDGDILNNKGLDTITKRLDFSTDGLSGLDSINPEDLHEIKIFRGLRALNIDTLASSIKITSDDRKDVVESFLNPRNTDSLKGKFALANRIIISITTDSIEIPEMNRYIREQLDQKKLDLDYAYRFLKKNGTNQPYNLNKIDTTALQAEAKSAYLPNKSNFTLYYSNIAGTVWQRNLLGILLSALLVASVIACLLFLLNIIKRQKQLAEVKNDLISNITHEFKTPIATISVALEGIKNFNTKNDPVKTGNYVNTSANQLNKLSMMVEKLLETATLDGDDLSLNIEAINLNELLQNLINKHQTLAPQKNFRFQHPENGIILNADPFHLENALNNLLDNAVKYGGEIISVTLKSVAKEVIIEVADSGNTLGRAEAKQLFEKFYRVPKGNTHDVKGFGIGLYYTKKIIEKHGGSINVATAPQTTFKIELPHG
ncbi:sensor histidine kinase [Leeuwenhoekiella sp. H156]|uniref:sensor histidine kinase n=1 Tax=Leeuwenhoekiella sp. H156 TaxID=3450128 RepID=UPI003FA41FFA